MSSSQDFSLFSLFTAGLACFTAVANAQGTANPIYTPGLNQVVPVGQPFNVTWGPTTSGPVSLLLYKGPATNLVLVYPIAQSINNSGLFTWTPKTDLGPGVPKNAGYGIKLVEDATGEYQYSTQFGIQNDNYSGNNSAVTTISSATVIVVPSSSALSSSTPAPVITSSRSNSTLTTSITTRTSTRTTGTVLSATTTTASATSTGGAQGLATSIAGLVVAAGVAVLAF